jgi:hypothetical protein
VWLGDSTADIALRNRDAKHTQLSVNLIGVQTNTCTGSLIMNRLTLAATALAVLAGGSLALAGTASAAAISGSSAPDTINQLRADGYNVQLNLNGTRDVLLSECTVTGTHGIPSSAPLGGAPTAQFTTVYVDVNCPSDN